MTLQIRQNPKGVGDLKVHQQVIAKGDYVSFRSIRQGNATLGLTVWIDGQQIFRLSACCEYRYAKNCRVGSEACRFEWIGVTVNEQRKCLQCRYRKALKPAPKVYYSDDEYEAESDSELDGEKATLP